MKIKLFIWLLTDIAIQAVWMFLPTLRITFLAHEERPSALNWKSREIVKNRYYQLNFCKWKIQIKLTFWNFSTSLWKTRCVNISSSTLGFFDSHFLPRVWHLCWFRWCFLMSIICSWFGRLLHIILGCKLILTSIELLSAQSQSVGTIVVLQNTRGKIWVTGQLEIENQSKTLPYHFHFQHQVQ